MLILLMFLSVATLGFGKLPTVIDFMTFEQFCPEILITAIPEIPGPLDKA